MPEKKNSHVWPHGTPAEQLIQDLMAFRKLRYTAAGIECDVDPYDAGLGRTTTNRGSAPALDAGGPRTAADLGEPGAVNDNPSAKGPAAAPDLRGGGSRNVTSTSSIPLTEKERLRNVKRRPEDLGMNPWLRLAMLIRDASVFDSTEIKKLISGLQRDRDGKQRLFSDRLEIRALAMVYKLKLKMIPRKEIAREKWKGYVLNAVAARLDPKANSWKEPVFDKIAEDKIAEFNPSIPRDFELGSLIEELPPKTAEAQQ